MEKWFSGRLINWYLDNKRDLPWRNQSDPYKIWLSEIILQQTQVAQGLSYYLKFTETYPTLKDLAKADENDVLKLWQGLGYYSRARNLHFTAKTILANYKGIFPHTYQEIKALKGIGDYTAAAISSFAYQLPHAVVDGNVYRVLSRIFGIETPIDSSAAKKEFQELATNLLNVKKPDIHNQAVMEFGSQYCKPANPDCENCIFKGKCFAFKYDKVKVLPSKKNKTKVRNRFFNYLVIVDSNKNIAIRRRAEGDIWQGLYEFPLIETEQEIEPDKLFKLNEFKQISGKGFTMQHSSKQYKHILSHQHLYAKFFVIRLSSATPSQFAQTKLEQINNFAFPRLIEKFLNDYDLKEIL